MQLKRWLHIRKQIKKSCTFARVLIQDGNYTSLIIAINAFSFFLALLPWRKSDFSLFYAQPHGFIFDFHSCKIISDIQYRWGWSVWKSLRIINKYVKIMKEIKKWDYRCHYLGGENDGITYFFLASTMAGLG